MEPILSSQEMRAYDQYAIETLRIPGIMLMENAGRGVVDMIERHLGTARGKKITIVAGKGNNGGDGFVVARHLVLRGGTVTVLLTCKPTELKGDALVNFTILSNLLSKARFKETLRIDTISSSRKLSVLPKQDIIVDALFGTGFSGTLKGKYEEIIRWINSQPAKRVSIDIPSGLSADGRDEGGPVVQADLTVTMAFKKNGLIVGNKRTYAGSVEVVDIGVPAELPIIRKCKTFRVTADDIRNILPQRPHNAHKHSVGKVFIVAGSRGLTGAAAMSARSAMKAGAGTVILGAPKSVYPILAKKLTEVMVEPLEDTPDGSISLAGLEKIRKHIDWSDIVVIGPGLSRNHETQELIRKLIREVNKPLVVDADGLNAIALDPKMLLKRKSSHVILTPHVGELSRIIKADAESIEENRIEIARKTAIKLNVTLVLKGSPTVTASAEGAVIINSSGNAGMATAGSGDVLTGVIAGLWGQKLEGFESAYSGVFLHGLAGDLAKIKYGEKSVMALDIQNNIPEAIRQTELGLS